MGQGGPSSNGTGVLCRRRPCEDRHVEEGHVVVKAETGVRQLHAEGRRRLPANRQSQPAARKHALAWLQRERGPADTLISDASLQLRDNLLLLV